MHIYIIRHGETYGNLNGDGFSETDLTPKGEEQARLLGERFKDKKLDKIYTSPLIRAVKTAKENGATNGFGEPQFTVLQGSMTDKVSGKFDTIAANIVADIIVMLCDNIKDYMNPGAVFITSGIIVPREDDVLAAFAKNGLEIIARHESGGWLCFETKVKS